MKELIDLQQRMKSPKSEYNKFGNFNYRNLEQMLTTLKPILKDYGCTVVFTDDIVCVGNKNYVKATVTISNGTENVSAVAFAQEGVHKGMSEPQFTGTASSYARKYALCGLLAIDDNKDPDELDNSDTKEEKSRYEQLVDFCKEKKASNPELSEVLGKFYKYYSAPDKDNPEKRVYDSRNYFNVEKMFERWQANEK